mgnify:CR=1 FL=1
MFNKKAELSSNLIGLCKLIIYNLFLNNNHIQKYYMFNKNTPAF